MTFLLDQDILSFDRLMQKSRETRNARLLEEASIMRIVVNSGFSGDDKAFKSLTQAYEPAEAKEVSERAKIKESARRIHNLFGG